MYQWWVFVHLVGVFAFLASHGVSMTVAFRLRKERDPRRIADLLQLSSSSVRAFYVALVLLLTGGTVAGFLGHWWGRAWIWASIGVLVISMVAMYRMASPYYRRVGFVARAKAEGGTSVTDEQLEEILRSPRSTAIIGIGVAGLVVILYMMLFKPTLGFSSPGPAVSGNQVAVVAQQLSFDTGTLHAPAGAAFQIVFDNRDAGVPHNVSIYRDSTAASALFSGEVVTGPTTVTYDVPSLPAGSYFFRCDVHPSQMTGTLVAGG